VQIFGKVERELTVEVDPHKLQAANVSVAQVAIALQSQNLAAPVGRVNGALDERAIRLKGRLDNPAEFENLVVAERNGQLIRLGQVATIKGRHRRAAHTRALQWKGSDRDRREEGEGLQHHRRRRAHRAASRRDQADAAAGHQG
jgi:multidrug efflux pump subunit AcrB